jgi:ABC-type sugar transport systems, permease components
MSAVLDVERTRPTVKADGRNLLRRQQERHGLAFLALPAALFVVFMLLPMVTALVLSLTDYSVIGETHWVGLENYARIVNDPFFRIALKNTVVYTLMYVPLGIVVALATALLLNRRSRAVKLFRTLYYIPVISSTVATATIWYWLLNPTRGLFNMVLGWFGIDGPAWLYDSRWAMFAIVMMAVWSGFGTNMMIYLAGLQGIPAEQYEAARIDGANSWQLFRYVTLPALSKTTLLVSTLLIISAFQVFDQAYVLTKGGPGNSTVTLVYYIYNRGLGSLDMGYASAISFVLFAIILIFSLINARVTGRERS